MTSFFFQSIHFNLYLVLHLEAKIVGPVSKQKPYFYNYDLRDKVE